MAKDRLSGKLAVILHADIAGSTALVQQDKQLAHERIQDTFQRFSDSAIPSKSTTNMGLNFRAIPDLLQFSDLNLDTC